MKKTNGRPLDAIATDINALERRNVIEVGDLLLEARAQWEPGRWLAWLDAELDMSADSAERRMSVAKLAGRFRKLRNLRLAKTSLYRLAYYEDEEELPAIVSELAKHASKASLAPR